MKGFIIVLLGIVAALLVIGGVVGHTMLKEVADNSDGDDSTIGEIVDKVSNVASSGSSDDSSSGSDIVSEVVKFNEQNGEGYYREVTYSDGGFRQYDTESGDLIGSSYDSDQNQLPSME